MDGVVIAALILISNAPYEKALLGAAHSIIAPIGIVTGIVVLSIISAFSGPITEQDSAEDRSYY